MPNIPYRSKLLPFWETIQARRRARQTWAEIARHLTDECGCPTSFQAVHGFYKRKARARVPLGFEEPEPGPGPAAAPEPSAGGFFEPPPAQPREWKKPKYNLDL